MLGKIIVVMIILVTAVLSFVFFYQNVPGNPIELEAINVIPESSVLIDYGAVPVFANNLRFNHNQISYFIDWDCSDARRESMIEGFDIFARKMKIVSFYEFRGDADIYVNCSDTYVPMGERLFAAGEGGPSRIINASVFKTIEKGNIVLYYDPRCDHPIVELHELGHVFGFDHSLDPENIMYNVSNCNQRISDDMITLINDLYSIEPLPDASISNVTAIKRGIYLDFNITVLNEGMLKMDAVNLSIFADGKFVRDVEFNETGIGYGRTIKTTGIRLPSRNVKIIEFIIDADDNIPELREDNNVIKMTLPSQ